MRIRDLEEATGLHSKSIEQILTKYDGNLKELISNDTLSPIKQLSTGKLNIALGEAHEKKQGIVYLTENKGKIKAFEKGQKLGSGSFKKVYAVTRLYHDTPKTLAYAQSNESRKDVRREFQAGKTLYEEYKDSLGEDSRAANIPFLKYYAVVDKSKAHSKKMGILMETGDKSLSSIRRQELSEQQKESITKELLEGVAFMHQRGMIHRDLKPDNILLKKDAQQTYHAKITDFGLSCNVNNFQEEIAGTSTYFPPEYFDPTIPMHRWNPQKFDSWALGVTLYELYIGIPPFFRAVDRYKGNRRSGEAVVRSMNSPTISDALNNLELDGIHDVIANLMNTDASKRWTVEKALERFGDLTEKASDENQQTFSFAGRLQKLRQFLKFT
ncbi:MAG: protein kinase domain-containing protein [Parachlamydiaceae bacterium]